MNHPESHVPAVSETLARVRALVRRDARLATGLLWLEGIRSFVQAYDARFIFETVVYSPRLLKSDLAEMLIRRMVRTGVRRVRVTPEEFRSVCTTQRASGIGAIAQQRWMTLDDPNPPQKLCWLIIEELRSPGNLGTILRTAEATGVTGIIFVSPACDPYDPSVMRACMGGIFHLPLIRTSYEELVQWIQRSNIQLVGLAPEAKLLWTQLQPAPQIALVIGEERRGLTERLRALCHTMVRLPMVGQADSLNVGVATGIMLYELTRQSQLNSSEAWASSNGIALDFSSEPPV